MFFIFFICLLLLCLLSRSLKFGLLHVLSVQGLILLVSPYILSASNRSSIMASITIQKPMTSNLDLWSRFLSSLSTDSFLRDTLILDILKLVQNEHNRNQIITMFLQLKTGESSRPSSSHLWCSQSAVSWYLSPSSPQPCNRTPFSFMSRCKSFHRGLPIPSMSVLLSTHPPGGWFFP